MSPHNADNPFNPIENGGLVPFCVDGSFLEIIIQLIAAGSFQIQITPGRSSREFH